MFRITEDPSSGNLVQCLAYSDPLYACLVRGIWRHFIHSEHQPCPCQRTWQNHSCNF